MQWKCFGGFSSFAWQKGTLQLIAIHLITLHNILEYMHISIIQTEEDFVKINVSFSKLLATTVHSFNISQVGFPTNFSNQSFLNLPCECSCNFRLLNSDLSDHHKPETQDPRQPPFYVTFPNVHYICIIL
jgi:hypothetical protein